MIKEKQTLRQKMAALNRATESFRATKKKTISKICSVGVKHRWLKYPSLIAAVLFISIVNVVFYVSLWIILNKHKAIGICIMAIASIGLLVLYNDYYSADSLYRQTEKDYVIYENSQDDVISSDGYELPDEKLSNQEEPEPVEWQDMLKIDFDGLHSINNDIVGWIYFENEDISYPILQGETNDDYLRTTYVGESSIEGSIFLESMNNSDFDDFHTIIYGHNMRNLSMFGRLRYYYKDSEYYNDHKYFQIITPGKKYRYEIVSYKHVEDNDSIYEVKEMVGTECNDFMQGKIMNGSLTGVNVNVSENDHIVTLSTCSSGDKRFVVSALRVDEEQYN